ncbi:hypothetical protein CF319_g5209 [Tilletia indica]|uniref:Mitochondrial inner membrane protease ATP23 n=1 Tax=Tilletia indica TaxID=43049 RepID=A0A177TT67_9BASI|nr:hypothetical protein CF319_g5209 [Tilletia indica]KAE8260199.1 hypothetical protein A4X13_0g503 [Tilletia indica]
MSEATSSSSSVLDSNPSFHRWLNACSSIFPSQDTLPFKRRRRTITSPFPNARIYSANEHFNKDEEQEEWKSGPETDEERKWRERAEAWAVQLAETSPMIRFLSRHLAMVSCNPYDKPDPSSPLAPDPEDPNRLPESPLGRIVFAACPPNRVGGFRPMDPPSESGILICSNRIARKADLERAMAHEMIHWWDTCRFRLNWNNLRHNACSEIRAAALSGDCKVMTEFGRISHGLRPGFLKQHQACTRRRAITSVVDAVALEHLEPDARLAAAERAVDEVWEACWNDTRPFDDIY